MTTENFASPAIQLMTILLTTPQGYLQYVSKVIQSLNEKCPVSESNLLDDPVVRALHTTAFDAEIDAMSASELLGE